MIRITENDLILFKYLFEEIQLERDSIKNYIWDYRDNSYIDNRLAQLINSDYLKTTIHPFMKNGKLIYATKKAKLIYSMRENIFADNYKKGNTILKYFNMNKYKIEDSFDSRRLEHDLNLTKLRLKFENLGVEEFESSIMLRRQELPFDKLLPDGRFKYKDKQYYLEFDNDNGYRRYKKGTTVYKNNLIKNVIFIFNRNYIPKGFKKRLTTKNDTFYFALFSDFQKDKIELQNLMNEKLIIGCDEN